MKLGSCCVAGGSVVKGVVIVIIKLSNADADAGAAVAAAVPELPEAVVLKPVCLKVGACKA